MNVQSKEIPPAYHFLPEETFEKFGTMVYRLAFVRTKNLSDADDILQDVFVRLIRSKKEFDSEEHLKAWLLRVTINRTNSLLSSPSRKRSVPLEETLATSMKEPSLVWEAAAKLPKKYRTVIHLYYYEDYSIHEMSQLLNKKETTLRSQLSRARDLLKNELKGGVD